MKGSVTLSSLAHVAILAWGLMSFSGPKPLVVADVEALPVDIVPMSEITNSVQGEKKADFTDKPAPRPTQRPQTLPDARNVGETELDARSQRPPDPKPREAETERADAPPPAPEPTPAPEVKPEPVAEAEPEPTPTTELAALSQPPVPVTEELPAETPPVPAEAAESFEALPQSAPVPERRPEPPKPRSAETPERKKPETQPKPKQTAAARSESKSTEDEIAALLNKEKPAASGARRSTDQASLGTRSPSNANTLTQSEMDALRAQIQACWNPPATLGADELQVSVRFTLDPTGRVEDGPTVTRSSGNVAADDSAKRAVRMCGQHGYKLPADKYDSWREVVVNFDPSQLF